MLCIINRLIFSGELNPDFCCSAMGFGAIREQRRASFIASFIAIHRHNFSLVPMINDS
jgi:hypothetical protein